MAYEDVPFLVASDSMMELSSPSPPFFCFSEDQSSDSSLFANLPMSHQDPASIMASLDKFSTAASKSINQSNGVGDDQLQKTQSLDAKRKRPNSEDGSMLPDTAMVKKQKKKSNISSSDEQPPKGYIHVRARRGEATDSHSLAERVRREKISERMRLLQALVPGCDKLTGKATVLDEIINYVLSLQTQVEVLSMKLSSLSPMVYNFDVDIEALMLAHQGLNMISSAQMGTSINNAAWSAQQATTTPSTRVNLSLIEAPNFFPIHQQHRQIWTSPPSLQGNTSRSLYML